MKTQIQAPYGAELTRLDVPEMLRTDPRPVPWVIEGFAARGMLTMLAGREGGGKSMWSQAITDAVAAGESVAGMHVPQAGRVAIIDAENGREEIHRRVKALSMGGQLGIDAKAPERISVYDAEGFDLLRHMGEIRDMLRLERPALFILDSFRSLWSGSEYSRQVAATLNELRALLRRYDCAGVLLHHGVKSDRKMIVRGSTMMLGCPEAIFFYAAIPGDPDPARRVIVCQKARGFANPGPRWVRIGQEAGMLVVDEAEPYDPTETAEQRRPVRDRLLESVFWTVYASEEPLRRSNIAVRLERDAKDRSVGRCLDQLVEEGRLVRDSDMRYSVAQVDAAVAGEGAEGAEVEGG